MPRLSSLTSLVQLRKREKSTRLTTQSRSRAQRSWRGALQVFSRMNNSISELVVALLDVFFWNLSMPALCVLGASSRSLVQLRILCSRPTLFHQNTHSRRKLGAHQVSECRSGAHTLSQREKESRQERERQLGVSPRPAKRPLLEHKSRGPGREIWGI